MPKARIAVVPPLTKVPVTVEMRLIEGPVWMKPDSFVAELFAGETHPLSTICFLGSSAESPNPSQKITHQLSDTAGRLSRAIPLFLAEQVEFMTTSRAETLIPWIPNNGGGFVLAGAEWANMQ